MSQSSGIELITLITAIVGALAWLPTLIPIFRRGKIEGKVISQYANFGKLPNGVDALILVQKMSLFSRNKDFFLKDILVYIKYPTLSQEIKCGVWAWRQLVFTFKENGLDVQKKLQIDAKDYLLHFSVLPKDQAVSVYISLSVDHLHDEKYEYIRYVFIDFKEKRRQFKIFDKDISNDRIIFDDDIWRNLPNNPLHTDR